MYPKKKYDNHWQGYIPPVRMAGNVYFVGIYAASTHLIDTGDGLILIDPGYGDSVHMIVDSIHRAGFDPRDIRYILLSHWHGDHAEGTPQLVQMSGAKVIIGAPDAEKVRRYCEPDILVGEGDTLTLGDTTLSFMITPGHTAGTLSFFFDVQEGGKTLRAGMFGGAGANTLVAGKFDFDGAREAYYASIARLQAEHVDVMLGNHVWNNATDDRAARQLATGEMAFIDDGEWGRFLGKCKVRLDRLIEKENNA